MTTTDADVARSIAQGAGQLLLELRESFGVIDPDDRDRANELRKAGDRASHEYIVAALAQARPNDAVLSEEGADNASRLEAPRVWIVDPLDGTFEYGQHRADFAVHIVLWDTTDEPRLAAGVVDLPAQGLTRSVLDTDTSLGELPNDRPIRVVASRSRPPATLQQTVAHLAKALEDAGITDQGVEVVDVGSVGAKVNEILSGRAEAYIHDTGFYEWDVAAPLNVAHHYGLHAEHIDGSPVQFNQMPPYVNNLVVARADLHGFVMDALRRS